MPLEYTADATEHTVRVEDPHSSGSEDNFVIKQQQKQMSSIKSELIRLLPRWAAVTICCKKIELLTEAIKLCTKHIHDSNVIIST